MNIGSQSKNELLFINFNQDFSCISIGTKYGYKIYNCDPFSKCYSKMNGGMGVVEMLFCTSLVALVGAGEQSNFSPRRLQIINTKRQSTICELTFPTTVLAVKLNRRRLVVLLEEQIYVYDISNMKLVHTIETSPNTNAVIALSPSSENCYLVYPSHSPSSASPFAGGDILIFDTLSLQVVNMVQAHKSPVSCVSINSDGTMMATASDKGTVIRVFSLPDAQKLYQFRRGSYPARIYGISFNLVSTLLCVSSDSDTVHIFKLAGPGGSSDPAAGFGSTASGSSGYGSGPLDKHGSPSGHADHPQGASPLARKSSVSKTFRKSMASYLPEMITEMWEPTRDFANLKLKGSGVQSLVALSK
ncbi:WD40-repeat-containing domain protein [Piptocephalis cylindrospora]|uniref:Autophagy-related protein 18 n=1 Tax=Piptocephalis cylindrospora TaxID=1907219 RepID=A0A4P9Y3N9_9FUNG|nr:WD40-repeat-containing domain protein [Piptocephalis cylindrospora]|eukprot:RKP13495.1 WD40-repeat-containing domain protein [Piptocephalis cylindrospora]